MDPRLELIIREVKDDPRSGAFEIFTNVLESFAEIIERPRGLRPADLREFCLQLHRAKGSMAPLFNLANQVLLSLGSEDWQGRVSQTVISMRNERDLSRARLIESLKGVLKGDRIMTISYSSTVLAALETIGRDIEVIVPVSLPLGEGREMARALVEKGIRSELIHDSMVFPVMEEMDITLVGSDAITPRGIVNKVGTFSMVSAANRFEIPAHVVCDWMKVSPVMMMDAVETQTSVAKDLTKRERIFELTPMELITSIITDRGKFLPEEILKRMEEMPVSKEWGNL